jgi:hypothetical protein
MKQPISTEDNLTKDLLAIINNWLKPFAEGGNARVGDLTEKLTIYIVNRDGKVLEHGIKVGRDQVNGN